MPKSQQIEVKVNNPDTKVLGKLMSKAIAEIVINRLDKLPEEIKGYAINELIKHLEE